MSEVKIRDDKSIVGLLLAVETTEEHDHVSVLLEGPLAQFCLKVLDNVCKHSY